MKLTLYVIREHIPPFIYSFCIITFLFVIEALMKLLDAIISKGLDALVILEYFILNMAWMIALSVPISCLVASLMAFGRLSGDNEIIALKANGVSPLRILTPIFLVSALICIGLVYFNNEVLPKANHRAAGLKSDISRKNAPAFITPRSLIKDFPNFRIWVDSIDYKTNILQGVKIYGWERRQPPRYMYSDKAEMEYTEDGARILIHLLDGENHIVDKKNPERYVRVKFKKQTISIENINSDLNRRERRSRGDREMSASQMYEIVDRSRTQIKKDRVSYEERVFQFANKLDSTLASDSVMSSIPPRLFEKEWWETFPVSSVFYKRLENREKEKLYLVRRYRKSQLRETKISSKYLVEIHKKFSIPVACIVFVLAGGSLGVLAKRGSIGVGCILSALFVMIYWVCLLGGESLADKLYISPWLAMWSPNIIVGVIGLFLLTRVLRLTGR